MTQEAVLERTDAPETKADPQDETKGPEATDVQGEVQTGDESTPTTTDEQSSPDAHLSQLEQERVAAAEAEKQHLIDQGVEARDKQRQAEAKESERRERIKESVPNAHKALDRIIEATNKLSLRDEEGNEMALDSKKFHAVVDTLALSVEEAVASKKDAEYNAAWESGLKTPERISEFWEKAKEYADDEGSLSVTDLQGLYTEMTALETKAVKAMTLEQAKAACPTLRREVAEALLAATKLGRENPLPAGEPPTEGMTVTTGSVLTLEEAKHLPIDQLQVRREAQRRASGY